MATKSETIQAVADRAGVSKKDAENILGAFFDHTAERIKKGEKIAWPGFGSFSMSERGPRTGRNPQTGESIQIKASNTPGFKAGKALKDALN